MASVMNNYIKSFPVSIEVIDPSTGITSQPKWTPQQDGIRLRQYHTDFGLLIGRSPTQCILLSSSESSKNPFFHNGCVYLTESDELFMTSNLLQSTSSSKLPVILISRISIQRSTQGDTINGVEWAKLRPPANMPMPAGGCAWKNGILFCSQGTMTADTGGLYHMLLGKPPSPVVTNYYGREFNSTHAVAVGKDGAIWFTDPHNGFEMEIRGPPKLPAQVYRFDPKNGSLRAVADGFGRPTGIAVSPDETTVYVSDTDATNGSGEFNPKAAASIYAFDVITRSGSPFLTSKRLFAHALQGVPACIKCDVGGNVYAACGDGVEVWDASGTLLGVVNIPGGATNFAFGRHGEMFICAEQRLWRLGLAVPG